MEYLLVAPEFISAFLQLLDPFEQCRIMPLIHPTKENRVYYHVSGLSREWVKHVVSDGFHDYMWEQF